MIFQPNLVVRVEEPIYPVSEEPGSSQVTHLIGKDNYPLTTSKTSLVYKAHYSGPRGRAFSGPVKKLTFIQLGSEELPDLSPYASTCTSVAFNGHIKNLYTAMEILRLLPNVRKVAFFVGESQRGFYSESFQQLSAGTPQCPNVQKLKVLMDHEYYQSCTSWEDNCRAAMFNRFHLNATQQSMVSLAHCILKHSIDSFPNLRKINVDLPAYPTLMEAVQNVLDASPGIKSKAYSTIKCSDPDETTIVESSTGLSDSHHVAAEMPLASDEEVDVVTCSDESPAFEPVVVASLDIGTVEGLSSPCLAKYTQQQVPETVVVASLDIGTVKELSSPFSDLPCQQQFIHPQQFQPMKENAKELQPQLVIVSEVEQRSNVWVATLEKII